MRNFIVLLLLFTLIGCDKKTKEEVKDQKISKQVELVKHEKTVFNEKKAVGEFHGQTTKFIVTEFKVFKTIKLGTGIKDADGYRKAIKDKRMHIGEFANDILGNPAFNVATKETEVDLVIVSVAELGFKDGAKLKDIYTRAKEKGLQLCPNEVGPQLRLQYIDQLKGEWLVVGMEPIAVSGDDLRLFNVAHLFYDGLWLDFNASSHNHIWLGIRRFIFVCPRK